MELIIRGLKLVQTCGACPEQYDVYDGTGKYVAYLRLRWGYFSARMGGPSGKEIYGENVGDNLTGCFSNEDEREEYLSAAIRLIKKEIKKNK
jgi:hypothetical protein